MSSIDVVDNVHCANLHLEDMTVPLYWVQSILQHDRTSEDVTPQDLLIGGGSGEHPALHIRNADLLPLWLLLRLIQQDDNVESSLSNAESLEELYVKHLYLRARYEDELNNYKDYPYQYDHFFCVADWPLSTLGMLENIFKNSKYKDDVSNYAEVALLVSVARFVMFDMPKEFFEKEVYDVIQKNLEIVYKYCQNLFQFSAPLNSCKSGKVIEAGKAKWGYSLNDYLVAKL